MEVLGLKLGNWRTYTSNGGGGNNGGIYVFRPEDG